jgi:hypothetical protein
MRFSGYARSQRLLAPVLATLAVLAIMYTGGSASAAQTYGFSAMALFGIFAWQSKLAFDTEPDAQRQLSYLAVGSARREVAAGLLAAVLTAVPTVIVGLTVPWLTGSVSTDGTVGATVGALGLGLWVLMVAAVPAVAIGAVASRPITRTRGWGVVTLVGGTVVVLVLDVADLRLVRWLVPQLMGPSRSAQEGDVLYGILVTVHALVWSALLALAYIGIRNRRR